MCPHTVIPDLSSDFLIKPVHVNCGIKRAKKFESHSELIEKIKREGKQTGKS